MNDAAPTVGQDNEVSFRCDRIYTPDPSTITSYKVITISSTESDNRPVITESGLTRAAHDVRSCDQL